MSDFVEYDDFDSAPADDTEAFAHFARRASRKFGDRIANLTDTQEDWAELNEARIGFHNYILAIAHEYEVPPFSEVTHVDYENYANKEWRAFKTQFDFRMATLLHSKARASRSSGFLLTENTKEGIRDHLAGLRKYIIESDLPEGKRKKLLTEVDKFETALHGKRMNMTVVYAFAGFILGNLSDVTTIADSSIAHRLLNNLFATTSEAAAKTEEIVTLMAPKPPLQITGPPAASRAQPKMSPIPDRGPRESFSADLDDEIPF